MIDTIVVPQGAEYQAVCRGLRLADADPIQVITIPMGTKNIEQILASYSQQLAQSQIGWQSFESRGDWGSHSRSRR